jgi:hypothetical protein
MARPSRRAPHDDQTGRAIAGKAIRNQDHADDRYQREQSAVRPFAEFGDQHFAPIAHGDEHVRAEEDDKPEDFDGEAHMTLKTANYRECKG